MKTLLYTQEFPPFKGGVANYYGELVAHWPRPAEMFVLNRKYYGHFWQYCCQFFDLFYHLKKYKIEYILVGQILPLGPMTRVLSLCLSLQYAVFLHGMDLTFALKSPRKAWLTKIILGDAHKIICANSYTAALVQEKFPLLAGKIIVVNPGVAEYDKRVDLPLQAELKDKPLLLSIGRLVERKGFATVIKVLPADFNYVIIGTGPDESKLKALAKENVFFVGAVDDTTKWSWLERCDFLVMPAQDLAGDFEGFGIVYLEANLVAKPVIAGNSGGVKDAVIDGLNGLIVDPNKPEELRVAILKLGQDRELRERLGAEGQRRARQYFDWHKKAKEVFESMS